MSAAKAIRRVSNPFERLFDALVDPARSERTMAVLLIAYVAIWSLYAAISQSSQDVHFDMGEMFAWSHQVGLSAPTHPPLGAWLVRAWFSLMPAEQWAYYLLSIMTATAGLWIAWRVSEPYLTPEKRVVVVLLLTFIPFYNFHALNFNANSAQTPFWAATTWFFLRSFETRRMKWAVLAGLGAAAAMLCKYWSINLLAGLALAAVTNSRRAVYFRSPAPWLTIATGAIALAPHVIWIAMHGSGTFNFALTSHLTTFAGAAVSSLKFLVGTVGYVAVPVALCVLATHPSLAAIGDTLWPTKPDRRTVVVAFAAPLLIAALTAIPLRAEIVSLWAISAMTLLPLVLLSSPLVTVIREAAIRLLALAIIFPLIMLAASPVVAVVFHQKGVSDYGTHYQVIARAVERTWRERTDKSLRIVGSQRTIVDGTNFYFANRPATFNLTERARTPWFDEDRIKRDGIAIVCPEQETGCVHEMKIYAARYGAAIEDVTLARRFLGTDDAPVRYQIVIIPPK